ncbi:MAG: hypothetical protein ACTHJ4_06860 [Candidatus Nucleicultricaceae bacterium]
MKNKSILMGVALTCVFINGESIQAAGPVAKGTPSPWISSIVTEITKFGQSESCADGRAIRKNHKNCATRDGAAIAKIVCDTHDHIYRDKFVKGQCGTNMRKAFGGVEDVGEYFEKAIDLGKADAIALACTPPLSQLRGKLKEVAEKKCRILGTPAAKVESKAIAEEAAEAVKSLPASTLATGNGGAINPVSKSVYDAIKKLNNKKITENMAINAANAVANAPSGLTLPQKAGRGMHQIGELTTAERAAVEEAIKSAIRPASPGSVSQGPANPPIQQTAAPTGLEDTPIAKAVYGAIIGLNNHQITQEMAVEAANAASDRPGGLFGKVSSALSPLHLSNEEESNKANEAIKDALRKSGVK